MEKAKTKKSRSKSGIVPTKPVLSREFSSGGVVYRKLQGQNSRLHQGSDRQAKFKIVWLLTKSSPSKLYPKSVWRLPKGWIDDEDAGLTPGPASRGLKKASEDELKGAALREVREEAGVEGRIVKKIGTERYFLTFKGKKILKFATFYLMEWHKDSPEGYGFETAEVAWLPYEDARRKLTYSTEKKMLDKAREILVIGVQKSLI